MADSLEPTVDYLLRAQLPDDDSVISRNRSSLLLKVFSLYKFVLFFKVFSAVIDGQYFQSKKKIHGVSKSPFLFHLIHSLGCHYLQNSFSELSVRCFRCYLVEPPQGISLLSHLSPVTIYFAYLRHVFGSYSSVHFFLSCFIL